MQSDLSRTAFVRGKQQAEAEEVTRCFGDERLFVSLMFMAEWTKSLELKNKKYRCTVQQVHIKLLQSTYI